MRFLMILLMSVLLTGCEKYALDRQMEELCKKDGGVRVLETFHLPAERFDVNGRVKSYRDVNAGYSDFSYSKIYGPEYRLEWLVHSIKNEDPVRGQGSIVRNEFRLTRISGEKILAISVDYSRVGGDLFYFGNYSSKICPSVGRDTSVEKAFVKGD